MSGLNLYETEVSLWTNIIQLGDGWGRPIGIFPDGTVVTSTNSELDKRSQLELKPWNDIIHLAAGTKHTIGLKPDGTALAVGGYSDNVSGISYYHECEVGEWTDIVQVDAGLGKTMNGLQPHITIICLYDILYILCYEKKTMSNELIYLMSYIFA